MKGVRFYLDYASAPRKRKGMHTENVIAVHVKQEGRSWSHVGTLSRGDLIVECISALFEEPNSPVCSSSAAESYIRDCCKFVSEERAREIHPKLFERLDQED